MQTMKNRGILTVVSGFSGSGKGTIMQLLLSEHPEYRLSISATTRAPRPYETDGKEYFFKTEEQFRELIRTDQLLEYARFVKHYYGTPRAYVQKQLEEGYDVILEIEMQGARQVKKRLPDAVMVFVTPPSFEELENRLKGRGTETEDVILGRLQQAVQEAEAMREYDYILVNENGKAEECAEKLHSVIQCEHLRMSRNIPFIENMMGRSQRLGLLGKGKTNDSSIL